jgi:ribosome-binding protein aMBF1 (putative translation factor)
MESNKSSLKVPLIISVLLNVALIIGLVVMNGKSNEQTVQITQLSDTVRTTRTEVDQKTQELTDVKADLERIRAEREKLGLQNDSLDQKIASLNTYITKIKKAGKIDAQKRKEMETMIAGYKEEIIKKDQEIAQLKNQNDSLTVNLSSVTTEKIKLGDSLSVASKELAYASILKADGIKVTALKENGKEMDNEEYKGSKIDRLKISFSIADNKAAKKNKKTFYVALVTPNNGIFSDANNGGGTATLANGTRINYTLNQTMLFDNSNQKVTFTMLKGFNYVPGTYNIIIYSEGYEIGEGKVVVK